MPDGLTALVFTALGLVLSSLWDYAIARWAARRALASEAHVRHLEAQLSQFYWPVYTRLMRDNALWPHLKRRGDQDPVRDGIAQALERDVILPNHASLLQIIEGNLHLAAGDEDVLKQVQAYVRHVAVFQALRAAGIAHDPIEHDEPWPGNLFPTIVTRTTALQAEYNRLLDEVRSRRSGASLSRKPPP